MVIQPNLEWYRGISSTNRLSPRCPFATVYRCPRFYQSLSLLGKAGSTQIEPEEDDKLKNQWEKSDFWPVTYEQATMIAGPGEETKHFWRFCPEVSFERFGLFASDLARYGDEIDVGVAHNELSAQGASAEDWRWQWAYIQPRHYTDCPLYSLIRQGKGKAHPKPSFPHLGLPDSITTHTSLVIEGDEFTTDDVEELIKEMYDHPEIKAWEFYSKGTHQAIEKAIKDYKIASDTVDFHYYKDPDSELNFIKINEKTAKTDWEKHIVANSPMYWRRLLSLTDKQTREMSEPQAAPLRWSRLQFWAAIASILGFLFAIYIWLFSGPFSSKAKQGSPPPSREYRLKDNPAQITTAPSEVSSAQKEILNKAKSSVPQIEKKESFQAASGSQSIAQGKTAIGIIQQPVQFVTKGNAKEPPDVTNAEQILINRIDQFKPMSGLVDISTSVPGCFQLNTTPSKLVTMNTVTTKRRFSENCYVSVQILGIRGATTLELGSGNIWFMVDPGWNYYYIWESEQHGTRWHPLQVERHPDSNMLGIDRNGRILRVFVNDNYVETFTASKNSGPLPVAVRAKTEGAKGGEIVFQNLTVWDFQTHPQNAH